MNSGSAALKKGVKDSTPRLVEGLEKEVRWQRVSVYAVIYYPSFL
jgi:hypothetical protein